MGSFEKHGNACGAGPHTVEVKRKDLVLAIAEFGRCVPNGQGHPPPYGAQADYLLSTVGLPS